ncbi:hypothetical protein [Levilactobacillus humaensis]|uniref:hypothetical protein n=1 Tax=Levilactobacillus humaensis TaxID=2950375 RepID=UPI0021C460F7|nr:hypothetical protein [Levilactobacillus humaensis]
MFKIKRKSALLLMLLGVVVGSFSVTNASADYQKKINTELNKVNINNLFKLNVELITSVTSSDPVYPSIAQYNLYQTYKLQKPLKITNDYKRKSMTLPKGAVVTGLSDGKGNLLNLSNMTLSIKNQKKVFKVLGNSQGSHPVNKNNGVANYPYTRETAFSHDSLASFPALSVKASHMIMPGTLSLPFISITSDSQLIYHTKGSKYKPTRYVKIKKFKRSHSKITYYLAKPIKGVTTKKVKSGKSHLYRVTFTIGHVIQHRDLNGDLGLSDLTINNGKQVFFLTIDSYTPTQAYIDTLTGYEYVSPENKKDSLAYIQSLY